MKNKTSFTLLESPQECSTQDVLSKPMTTLFGVGIINPLGPTITIISSGGELHPGQKNDVFHTMLNPFSQTFKKVGDAVIGEDICLTDQMRIFFDLEFGCCPTFLLPGTSMKRSETVGFFAGFLQQFEDSGRTYEKVKKFPGDPWTRVQEDMDLSLESINSVLSSVQKNEGITNEQSLEMAGLLLEPENKMKEFQAFSYAWKGSLEFQNENGNSTAEALSFEDFLKIFAVFAESSILLEKNT